jgi:hypothetical protein
MTVFFWFLEYRTMEKVKKPSSPELLPLFGIINRVHDKLDM